MNVFQTRTHLTLNIIKMKNKKNLVVFLIFVILFFDSFGTSVTENVKKSVDDIREDNGETGDDENGSLEIPAEPELVNASCTRRQNSQMHEIKTATNKQFPFMVSIMSQQNEHLCSGSVISNGLILTTAQCVQQPISNVLVNTTSDKKDDTTVSLHVIKSEKFPSYKGSESVKDVAIIYTEKHNKSIASKLNLNNATETKGDIGLEALGFGLNTDVGKAKYLQYIGVEIRVTDRDRFKGYIDCIETKVPTCFKDTGGPAILDNQLYGIVIKGTPNCLKEITSAYAINKHVVDILPIFTFKAWLDEKIKKNEEQEPIALESYPSVPVFRRNQHAMMSDCGHINFPIILYFLCMSAVAVFN